MAVVTPYKAIGLVTSADDPKKAIQSIVGDLTGYELSRDLVLVGIFMRPEKTKGGIIRPDMNKEEDVWQGKVGLILTCGPDAFRDPGTGEFYEQRYEIGDWVQFFVGDGRQTQINGMPCRIIRDTNIVARLVPPFNPMNVL